MMESLQAQLGGRIRRDEPLAKYTNFRIGGPARYFFEAQSIDEIVKAITAAQELGVSFFVLGGGSNVLVSDAGFDGLVIKAANRNYSIKLPVTGYRLPVTINAESGVLSAFLARKTAEAGLTGFEWAISLPGTIGGAVRGNAGCFGGEMRDVIVRIRVFTPPSMGGGRGGWQKNETPSPHSSPIKGEEAVIEFTNADCKFGYRDSIFKHMEPTPIILSAEFLLRQDDPKACLERLEATLRLRKEKQPLDASSAGCLFKNFEFHERSEIAKLESKVKVPEEFIVTQRIPAGWIIDQLGLKGARIGDIQVSEKHGNFMTNLGKATADEVVQLAALIKTRARNDFGIQLHEEVQYVGFKI